MPLDIEGQMKSLKVVLRRLDDLIPYAMNARTHSEAQIDQIAASIKEFGFNAPILTDGHNGIVAGHGRALGARKLGLEKVPTIDLSHLDDRRKRAYILADNRIALNSKWDDDILASELGSLAEDGIDALTLGFDDFDLKKLLNEDEPPVKPPEDFDSYGEDIQTEHQCPSCGYAWSGKSGGAKKPSGDDAGDE